MPIGVSAPGKNTYSLGNSFNITFDLILKQEMIPYMIIIGACAHNKGDKKQSENT
jgi:hypothetical protein